jgi:hypothetical protein
MNQTNRLSLRRCAPLLLLVLAQACNFNVRAPASTLLPLATTAASVPNGNTAATQTAASMPTDTATPILATPTETPFPLVYPAGPSGFPSNVDPLTGLVVADPSLLNRRPLAIKVSNFPRTARPQAGLSKADILWEFYTEFGNTRWVAMFYGQDAEKVGPIRSARVLDTRIVPLYDAILVHVQAYETVWEEISKSGIDTINEFPASCPAICRDSNEPVVENSAFGNTIELTKYAQRIGLLSGGRPNLDGMVFDPAAPSGADPSTGVWIFFSSSAMAEWKYDPASGRYLRSSERDPSGVMIPLADRTTGAQLAVDNVLVLDVNIFSYKGKTGNGEQFDMDLSSSGTGYFYRDGVVVQGKWKSGGPNVPLQFVDKDGNNYALHPGTTYIAIIGNQSTGGRTASTEWRFFNVP